MTPPLPPAEAGGDRARAERAKSGSRRRRDLEALAATRNAAPAGIRHTDRADAAWTAAVAALRLRPSTLDSWINPATVLGELDGALCVEADRRVADWMRRRFGAALGEAIRAKSELTGLRVFDRGQS